MIPWLSSNILVSLEGVTTAQNSFFSHTFLLDSKLLFVLKERRQFNWKKSPSCFNIIFLNNVDNFFNFKICHPSLFGIMKRIIWFSWFQLCFEINPRGVFVFLTYNTLKATFGLFFSNFSSHLFLREILLYYFPLIFIGKKA